MLHHLSWMKSRNQTSSHASMNAINLRDQWNCFTKKNKTWLSLQNKQIICVKIASIKKRSQRSQEQKEKNISDSAELIRNLNMDYDVSYFAHYQSKSIHQKDLCQLKEFDSTDPFDVDVDMNFIPKKSILNNALNADESNKINTAHDDGVAWHGMVIAFYILPLGQLVGL